MKHKHFVLISTTRGDELIRSEKKVVATSANREHLEKLKDERAKERTEWLSKNSLPWWVECSVISDEEIQEVEAV